MSCQGDRITYILYLMQVNACFYALVHVFCDSSVAFKFQYDDKTVVFVLKVFSHWQFFVNCNVSPNFEERKKVQSSRVWSLLEGYLTILKGCFTLLSCQNDWVISFFHFIRQVSIRFYALVYVFCNSSLVFKFEYNNKMVIFVFDVANHWYFLDSWNVFVLQFYDLYN